MPPEGGTPVLWRKTAFGVVYLLEWSSGGTAEHRRACLLRDTIPGVSQMKYYLTALVVLALLAGSNHIVSAQTQNLAPPAAAKPSGNADNPVLNEIHFRGQNLSEAVEYLRKSCPHFQAVVVSDGEHNTSEVGLPDIDLKNIDLNQLIEVLKQTVPQLAIDRVAGDSGTVFLFRLSTPAAVGSGATGGRGLGPAIGVPSGYVPSVGAAAPPPPSVQVYRLGPLLPPGEADEKKALNDILTLVQAALEAHGSANKALMKVHEATQTLIFRGNAEQTEVVQAALKALEPTSAESERAKLQERVQADRDRMQVRLAQLEDRLKEAEVENAQGRKRISEQTTELEILRARLAAQGDKKQ
jgi:hypothetical protein